MNKMKSLILKYYFMYHEIIMYLIFGGLATGFNIISYMLLSKLGLDTWVANALAWAFSVLFAYYCNRKWVFKSHKKGKGLWKEFNSFVMCRALTGVIDEIIVVIGVDYIYAIYLMPFEAAQWGVLVKVISNLIVIILNYVFSVFWIFKKKRM